MPTTTTTYDVLPADLQPFDGESVEERFGRWLRTAALIRRRRRTAGLTLKQVALASMIRPDRVARLEGAHNYLSPGVADRLLIAIERLERDGAGDPTRAAQAQAEYEAEEEGDGQ